MPQMTTYALIMLIAGIGIPILAALNSALGQRLGNPYAASVILFSVALTIVVIGLLITKGTSAYSALPGTPISLYFAGSFVAFYVLSVTYVAPHFGIGNAIFFVLLGQMISAAAIDHFGLFGAQVSPITLNRAGGIALMAAGLYVIQKT